MIGCESVAIGKNATVFLVNKMINKDILLFIRNVKCVNIIIET